MSLTPPTVLDPKYKGKYIFLNLKNNIAKGKGLVIGKESLNTDKIYFEVKFRCNPGSKGSGSSSSSKGSGGSSKGGSSSKVGEDGVKFSVKKSAKKTKEEDKKEEEDKDEDEDEETASVVAAATAATATAATATAATAATATAPPSPSSSSSPPFQLGVIVKSSVTSRKTLSGSGQSNNIHEDDKTRWMWTWVNKKHVLFFQMMMIYSLYIYPIL